MQRIESPSTQPAESCVPRCGQRKFRDMRRACFTSVERKALAHDLDRLGLAGAQLLGAMDWMPEAAHECAGDGARPSGDEILVAELLWVRLLLRLACGIFLPESLPI